MPPTWVDIQEKINVTFTTEDYVGAEYYLLPSEVRKLTPSALNMKMQKLVQGRGGSSYKPIPTFR
jgi:hypothetical protein